MGFALLDVTCGFQFGLEQSGARPVGFSEGHGLRGLTPRVWALLVVVLRLVRNSIFCACRAWWGCFNLLSIA